MKLFLEHPHFLIGLCLTAFVLNAKAADQSSPVQGYKACMSGEKWDLGNNIPTEYTAKFQLFLDKKLPLIRGFSEGLALRKKAELPEQKYFAEYWVARSLYESKLVHIAHNGFSVLIKHPVTSQTAGVQIAALNCLVQIHNQFSAIEVPSSIMEQAPTYLSEAKKINQSQIVWDAMTVLAIQKISQKENVAPFIEWLSASGPNLALVQTFLAAKKGEHEKVITSAKAFFSTSPSDTLARFSDTAHILAARSFYSLGEFEQSITQFKQVSRSSNDLAETLGELSWSYLMDEKYKEAIGTAMNLQSGGLKKTFTPEAPMVMAMAMNELCQYPDSVKAANIFRSGYETSYKWLDEWKKSAAQTSLYKLAVSYLNKKPTTVPTRIASEWIRSPLFISHQEELNLLFDEKDAAPNMNKWGSAEQNRLAGEILKNLKDLTPNYLEAKERQKPGQPLPGDVLHDLAKLKEDLSAFRRMQKAAPVWKAVLAHNNKIEPQTEKRLAAEIEADLRARSQKMHAQLDEIAENIQLIEVEIYNGASEDVIWQNAHPEYKKIAKELDNEQDRTPASQTWNWGKTHIAAENETVEVWEDELGSFKADVVDNCSSKDKFMAIQSRRFASGLGGRSPASSQNRGVIQND